MENPENKVGFTRFAENLNGRLAMLGFVIAIATELMTGKGILAQLGLMQTAQTILIYQSTILFFLCMAIVNKVNRGFLLQQPVFKTGKNQISLDNQLLSINFKIATTTKVMTKLFSFRDYSSTAPVTR